MKKINEILNNKRKETENHIKKLQSENKQGIRYTIMMPNIMFMILGLLNDAGWIIHLVAGVIYLCKKSLLQVFDYISIIPLITIVFGISYLIYLNKIHEKEIATRIQKNLSFGLTIFSGLAGTIIALLQIIVNPTPFVELDLVIFAGLLNFLFGLPIFLSFKKGIFYHAK